MSEVFTAHVVKYSQLPPIIVFIPLCNTYLLCQHEEDDKNNRFWTLTLRPTTATTTKITEGLCHKKVQVLLLGALESVMLEDEDEMNALEYASMRSFRCVTKRDATGEENYKEGGKSVFDTPICFRSR